MTASTIGYVFSAVVASSALTALIQGLLARNKARAEASSFGARTLETLDPIVSSWLDRMQTEINDLRVQVAKLEMTNRLLVEYLDHHGLPIPPLPEDPK